MRVLTVVGNRPQFVKSAPVALALREAGLQEIVVHTGQHWDPELSAVFFDELGLDEPAHRLDLRTADVDAIASAVGGVIAGEQPDAALVFGDTNTTLGAARAARSAGIPVAHVEAGLRSGDLSMPEERNRIEVDATADLLLCPDERSRRQLEHEGVPGRIEVTGDVMADACRMFAPVARERAPAPYEPGTYVVATVHREANVRPPRLGRILEGLGRLGEPVLFPAHPRTLRAITEEAVPVAPHIAIVEPLGYLGFSAAASAARVIVTDSGGLQKEAYWYGVPCVTTRPSTEWVDTVEAGANVLVDDDPDALVDAVARAHMPDERPVLYGDGHAAGRVASSIARFAA